MFLILSHFAILVAIGTSSPLAFCTIFIIISSEVIDLHVCICIRTSHCLYLCTRVGCAPQLRCRSLPRPCRSLKKHTELTLRSVAYHGLLDCLRPQLLTEFLQAPHISLSTTLKATQS